MANKIQRSADGISVTVYDSTTDPVDFYIDTNDLDREVHLKSQAEAEGLHYALGKVLHEMRKRKG